LTDLTKAFGAVQHVTARALSFAKPMSEKPLKSLISIARYSSLETRRVEAIRAIADRYVHNPNDWDIYLATGRMLFEMSRQITTPVEKAAFDAYRRMNDARPRWTWGPL
jgi:hypothetical protein